MQNNIKDFAGREGRPLIPSRQGRSACHTSLPARKASIDQAAIHLAALIEQLNQFAEYFDLPLVGVFPELSEHIAGQGSRACADTWLRDQHEGADCLALLLKDFQNHHRALLSAMDGVALTALAALQPYLKQQIHSTDPVAVLTSHHRCYAILEDLLNNPELRIQKIVAPGLVSRYVHNVSFVQTSAKGGNYATGV